MTRALEAVWPRHAMPAGTGAASTETNALPIPHGARMRAGRTAFRADRPTAALLVAKLGQDGHDRGAKVVATGWPMQVRRALGDLFSSPGDVVDRAIAEQADVIGISSLSAPISH